MRLAHEASGLSAEAVAYRESRRNLLDALHKLRMALALAPSQRAETPDSSASVRGRNQGNTKVTVAFRAECNPTHADYPSLVFLALLALTNFNGHAAPAAEALGCTVSALTRFFKADKLVWARVREIRTRLGLHPLK